MSTWCTAVGGFSSVRQGATKWLAPPRITRSAFGMWFQERASRGLQIAMGQNDKR